MGGTLDEDDLASLRAAVDVSMGGTGARLMKGEMISEENEIVARDILIASMIYELQETLLAIEKVGLELKFKHQDNGDDLGCRTVLMMIETLNRHRHDLLKTAHDRLVFSKPGNRIGSYIPF